MPIADVNILLAGLTFTPAPNFNSNFTIATNVSDGVATPIIDTKNMTGTAANDMPTDIALTNNNVDENLAIGTLVGTFSTTDVDTGDTFTYSFCGGTNDASFSLSGKNQLLTAASFNFEGQNSYSICIRSTDPSTAFFDETFIISVNNVNEAPVFTSASVTSVNEDAIYTYNVITSDPDLGDTLVITAPTLPSWLSLTDNGNGTATLTGTPTNANVGLNPVILHVSENPWC